MNKDYRELQLSSSQLVIIFAAILVLGVIIFLLGVSVGKKQTQIASTSQITAEPITEKVEEEKPAPIEEAIEKPPVPAKDTITEILASQQKAREDAPKKTAAPLSRNLYYIQVGAFKNRESAYSVSDKLKSQGFSCLVRDPAAADRRGFYKVWVGGFETREKAEERMSDLARVEGKKKTDYFIVKH